MKSFTVEKYCVTAFKSPERRAQTNFDIDLVSMHYLGMGNDQNIVVSCCCRDDCCPGRCRIVKASAYLSAIYLIFFSSLLVAGGGLVLRDDVCIISVGFYEAHFTAYQTNTRGNTEFCGTLPDLGETLFVLDYLHDSMTKVPIDFRVVRDTTGMGQFVKSQDLPPIGDLEAITVFYQPPLVETDASLQINVAFAREGRYIGIVTAGHPTKDLLYTAVFPFSVGRSFDFGMGTVILFFFSLLSAWLFLTYFYRRPSNVKS